MSCWSAYAFLYISISNFLELAFDLFFLIFLHFILVIFLEAFKLPYSCQLLNSFSGLNLIVYGNSQNLTERNTNALWSNHHKQSIWFARYWLHNEQRIDYEIVDKNSHCFILLISPLSALFSDNFRLWKLKKINKRKQATWCKQSASYGR